MSSTIAIIGAGSVGAATAYTLVHDSVCKELLLIDTKIDFRDGQVRDLSDASFLHNSSTRVRAGSYEDAGQCDIVVITVGAKWTLGETKLLRIYRNSASLRTVLSAIARFRKDIILIIVSNPVDVLTALACKLSGLPPSQVLGCGTLLDSIRLRGLIANKIGVAVSEIDSFVLGEHGDSQFVAWSISSVGGVPIDHLYPPGSLDRDELAEKCRHEGQRTMEVKGKITYGIGAVVSSCSLSLPVILGRKGIIKTLPVQLNEEERAKLAASADVIKRSIESL